MSPVGKDRAVAKASREESRLDLRVRPLSPVWAHAAEKDLAEEGALARKNQPTVAWRTARGKVRWRGRPWALGGADG